MIGVVLHSSLLSFVIANVALCDYTELYVIYQPEISRLGRLPLGSFLKSFGKASETLEI
jgi:hypothetical protein